MTEAHFEGDCEHNWRLTVAMGREHCLLCGAARRYTGPPVPVPTVHGPKHPKRRGARKRKPKPLQVAAQEEAPLPEETPYIGRQESLFDTTVLLAPSQRRAEPYLVGEWTQKRIIVEYLLSNRGTWLPSYQLRGSKVEIDGHERFLGHQGDRRARELAEAGAIEVDHSGKYAMYRFPEDE